MAGKKYHLQVVIGATNKAGAVLNKVGAQLKSAVSSIGAGITRLRDALDLGQYAVGAGKFLAGLATDAADAGSEINDLAARTGLASDTIQELGYAARLAGASSEEWGSALDTVTKNMGMLLAGKGKLKGFLGEVAGPGFVKALKAAKPDERLDLIFGAMLQIEDPARRAAFATQFFGEAGAKIAPLANEGADGIARMRKEAHDLGLVMGGEDVAAMDEFGDETAKLGDAWTGVKRQFGVALAREFLPLIKEGLTWLKANRSEVGKFAKAFAGGVLDAAKAVMGAFKWIYDHREAILDWAKTLAIVIGSIKVAGLIGDLGKLGGLVPGLGRGGGAGAAGAAGGILGGGLIGGLSIAGVGAIGLGIGSFIDSYFPSDEERAARRKDAWSQKKLNDWSINGGAFDNIMVPSAPDGSRAPSSWLGEGAIVKNPTAQQLAMAQAYVAQRPAAFAPLEVKLTVQDPNGLLGQPRVEAAPGTKVTTKKLNSGKSGSARP